MTAIIFQETSRFGFSCWIEHLVRSFVYFTKSMQYHQVYCKFTDVGTVLKQKRVDGKILEIL